MIYDLYPESYETEGNASKTEISDQFCFKREEPRTLQMFTRQHSTSSPRVVDNREVVPPAWKCAAASGHYPSKNFWQYIRPLYCRIRHFSKFATSRFFLIPGTETSIERLWLCWHSDHADGGDKTALQNFRKGFPRLLHRPPEMKEIVYWYRRKLFRRRSLAPDWKYAVLFIPSVSELRGRMFK